MRCRYVRSHGTIREQFACPSSRRARVSSHFPNPAYFDANPSGRRADLSDRTEFGSSAICRRPRTCRDGRLIAGHQIWTALAGITLGLALLMRNRGGLNYLLGVSGFIWSCLDHIANNFGNTSHGFFAKFLNGITGNGWITIYLFVLGFIAAIAFDGYIAHTALPPLPELKLGLGDSLGRGRNGLISAWNFLLTKRALAFALFQYWKVPASAQTQLGSIIGNLASTLDRLTPQNKESLPGAQAPGPSS